MSDIAELAVLERKDLSWSDRIALLAYKVSQSEGAINDQDDFGVRHMFQHEWYIREFDLPANCTFVGRVHKQGHIVKLLSGRVWLATEGQLIPFTGPAVIHTNAGFQTVCYTTTRITAQTWHFNPDSCRDIDELEDEYFGPILPVLQRGEQLALPQLGELA